jgi:hypothetical protein
MTRRRHVRVCLLRLLAGMVELLLVRRILWRVLSAEGRALIQRLCPRVPRWRRRLSRVRGVRHRRMGSVGSLRVRVERVRVLLRHRERICERDIGLLLLLLHRWMIRRDRHPHWRVTLKVAPHFRMIRSMGLERHHNRRVVRLRLYPLAFMRLVLLLLLMLLLLLLLLLLPLLHEFPSFVIRENLRHRLLLLLLLLLTRRRRRRLLGGNVVERPRAPRAVVRRETLARGRGLVALPRVPLVRDRGLRTVRRHGCGRGRLLLRRLLLR